MTTNRKNMDILPDCPDTRLLQCFVEESPFDDLSTKWTRDTLEQHVNTCEECQRSIERLVAGQESWEGVARELAEIDQARRESSSETPALRDLIDHEKGRVPGTATGGTDLFQGTEAPGLSLDFLLPSEQPDSLGRLGSYEILEIVGRGGMGLVFKAYDTSLRRIVAIKVIAGHLSSSTLARRRFVREARAAAAVSHEHVVSIYAVEENQETPFIVMQFVSGKNLQERVVASGPLAVTEILRIGMQTAAGLAAAHAQGLVHRDIKPANILLENGVERVKITDFGLARAVDDVGMTQTGVVAGTPQYMAPEQANGESIDVRSDLFSLGSVLYTLCTGRPPFRATTTMGLLKRICEESPRPIRELNPDIPEWLDEIITKLLKKHPADRFQTAREVAELLGNWLAHVQHPTSVPAPVTRVSNTDTKIEKQIPAESPITASSLKMTPSVSTPERSQPNSRAIDRPIDGLTGVMLHAWQWLWGDYSRSKPFQGDPGKGFDLTVASLTASGFTLNERTESRLSMTGPGLNQLRGNVLAAASRIDVAHAGNMLSLHARMGTLRTLHSFLLALLALGWLVCFARISAPPLLGLLGLLVFGLFIAMSIVFSRREIRKAFDNLLGNIVMTGRNGHDPKLAPPEVTHASQFRQRIGEAYPSRIYWVAMLIWGAFMIPLIDSMPTIPFPVTFWVALAFVTLGLSVPTFAILYALAQKQRSGDWSTTILKGPPRRFLLNPVFFLFLGVTCFWIWQQLTCGVVTIDVDDRQFTVSLSRNDGNNRMTSIGNYSADFYPLRLKAGKYYWDVKHGSTVITGGEFELNPRGRQVIFARSPYPLNEADITMLPGRWKLGWQMRGTPSVAQQPLEENSFEYVDVSDNRLRISSLRMKRIMNVLQGKSAIADDFLYRSHEMVFAIRFPGPPADQRGSKWIDLLSPVNDSADAVSVVAHGIFSADATSLTMRLAGANFPRPTDWINKPDDHSITVQFRRADDLLRMQGSWKVQDEQVFGSDELSQALRTNPEPITVVVHKDQVEVLRVPGSSENALLEKMIKNIARTLKLDPSQDPKRITVTDPPDQGRILIQEGIYRFDGDRLIVAFGEVGRIPKGFDGPSDDTVVRLLLQRSGP